jgi:hypothetical protein
VRAPDGSVFEVTGRDGAAEFGQTDKLGFYEVAWNGEGAKQSLFSVNLLSPSESDIRPQSLQEANGGAKVQEMESVARQNREIWRWLAAAGLMVLMVEWWAYHRRVG